MSTTIKNKAENKAPSIAATASKTVKRSTTTRRAPQAQPASPQQGGGQSVERIAKRPASEISRLAFMAILGSAACIALVGVVGQATEPGTSPDDPAPVVIVELAD